MNQPITLYRRVANDLAERLVRELDGEIQAVVLYGSVARGEATTRSDIDLLIVSPHKDRIRTKVVELEEAIDAQGNYRTFLVSAYFTSEELRHFAQIGSPYVLQILGEGIALYDDGTFSRLREEVVGAGRRNAGRGKVAAPEPAA